MLIKHKNNIYKFDNISVKYYKNDMFLNDQYTIEFYNNDKFVFEAYFDNKYKIQFIDKKIKYADKDDLVEIDPTFDNKVLIIDGYNLFSRAFKSFSSFEENAIYGFFYYLRILDYSIRPHKIVIVFDGGGHSSYKESIYKHYKMPSNKLSKIDFKGDKDTAFTRLLNILDWAGIKYLKISNVEADDIISILTRYYLSDLNKVYIFSNDSDLYQLLAFDKNNVIIVRPLSGGVFEDIDYDKFYEKNHYLPENIVYLKAMAGDKSDNIQPSCKKSYKYILDNLFISRPYYENIDDFLSFFKKKCEKVYNEKFDVDKFKMNYKIISLQERHSYINETVIDFIAKYSDTPKKSNIEFLIKYKYNIPDIGKFIF